MQLLRLLFALVFGLLFLPLATSAAALPVTEVKLEQRLEADKGPVKVEAGDGVSFEFGAADPNTIGLRRLTVWDGPRSLGMSEAEALFFSFARVEFGASRYWILAGFTGGAHCCTFYLIFCRPSPGQPLKLLKHNAEHDGEPEDLQGAFLVQDGQLYFRDWDIRFDYFFSSHGDSLLTRFPARHWLLTPNGVTLNNLPFKASYLAAVPEVERELARAVAQRTRKPPAILKKEDFGWAFSDEVGQLLVKRTILLLYAREEARAWQALGDGVQKYYQSSRGLAELTRALKQQLAAGPY